MFHKQGRYARFRAIFYLHKLGKSIPDSEASFLDNTTGVALVIKALKQGRIAETDIVFTNIDAILQKCSNSRMSIPGALSGHIAQ